MLHGIAEVSVYYQLQREGTGFLPGCGDNSFPNTISFGILTAKKQSHLLHLPGDQKHQMPATHLSKFVAFLRQILTILSFTMPVASWKKIREG